MSRDSVASTAMLQNEDSDNIKHEPMDEQDIANEELDRAAKLAGFALDESENQSIKELSVDDLEMIAGGGCSASLDEQKVVATQVYEVHQTQ